MEDVAKLQRPDKSAGADEGEETNAKVQAFPTS